MKIYIDGSPVEVREGQTILEAALNANIYIPHLCSHPDLPVIGEYSRALREVGGKIVKTCETPVRDGMEVSLKSEKARHQRNVALELILASHPHDCSSCKAYLKCELQAITQYADVTHSRLRTVEKKSAGIHVVNPLIVREMERCISCGRCVRACRDLRGVGILQYNKLGCETYVGTEGDLPLKDAGCRFCGACIEVCPTGALQDAEGLFRTDLPRSEALIPCRAECPAHVDIPAYIRAVSEGRLEDANAILHEKVPFPMVLGHICNHVCEKNCKRGQLDNSLAIRNLKRYIVENSPGQKWKEKTFHKERSGKKIAIVGSGPCGLTAGYYLNKLGHDVTIYEKRPLPGGPMTSGIPEYRLPLEETLKEIQVILDDGVRCECNTEISDVKKLKGENDAVLVAVGVSKGKKLPLPGSDSEQVYTAMDILSDCRAGRDMSYLGEKVCVVGAGSVGYDVARSLIRKGVTVYLTCLEQKDQILADMDDQTEGEQEGICLLPGRSFEEIETAGGRVTGLRVHSVLSSTYDRKTGKVTEVAEPDSQMVIACDSVVFATGQHTGLLDYDGFGIQLNQRGYPEVDGFQTSEEGIFAAGDAITGISFVIQAIEQGRQVSQVMDRYLGGDGVIDEVLCQRDPDPEIGIEENFGDRHREEQQLRDAELRKHDFKDVYCTFTCSQAKDESGRCLQCDLRTMLDQVKPWTEYSLK